MSENTDNDELMFPMDCIRPCNQDDIRYDTMMLQWAYDDEKQLRLSLDRANPGNDDEFRYLHYKLDHTMRYIESLENRIGKKFGHGKKELENIVQEYERSVLATVPTVPLECMRPLDVGKPMPCVLDRQYPVTREHRPRIRYAREDSPSRE